MLGDHPHRGKWRQVTAHRQCPICCKPDWCSVSADASIAACRRVELGAFKAKLDRSGVPVYLHRLSASPQAHFTQPPKSSDSTIERADSETLNQVYNALLSRLFL